MLHERTDSADPATLDATCVVAYALLSACLLAGMLVTCIIRLSA
ncbi:MAG TPA: hypothetical protein VFB41_07440 [Solirubrobacteraceae bacterium]|nr:hypothetical protein [Solirubrobacteraceae bacterium]